MRRLRNILLGLLLTVALLLAFVPMGVGLFFAHNYYPVLLKRTAEREHIAISLQNYHWGWFSSHASVAVTLSKGSDPLILRQTIHTGPVLRVPGKGLRLAFAWIGTKNAGKHAPFAASTLVTSAVHTRLLAPHIDIVLNEEVIQAHHVVYHRTDRENSHQYSLAAGSFDVSNVPTNTHEPLQKISGANLAYTSFDHKEDDAHNTKTLLQAKQLYVSLPNIGIWEAKNLTGMVEKLRNGKLIDMNYLLHASRLSSPTFPARQIAVAFSIKDVYAPALNKLLNQLPQFGQKQTPKQFLALYLMMGKLLKHGVTVQLNKLSMSSNEGPIHASGSVSLPSSKDKNPANYAMKHLTLRLQADLPQKTFLGLLTQYLVSKQKRDLYFKHHTPVPTVTNAQLATIAEKAAYAQTIQWASQGAIKVDERRVSFHVLLENEQWFFITKDHLKHPLKWLPLPAIKAPAVKKMTPKSHKILNRHLTKKQAKHG